MYSHINLALRFAEYLVQNYNKDPDVTWILDFTRIHIVFHGKYTWHRFRLHLALYILSHHQPPACIIICNSNLSQPRWPSLHRKRRSTTNVEEESQQLSKM